MTEQLSKQEVDRPRSKVKAVLQLLGGLLCLLLGLLFVLPISCSDGKGPRFETVMETAIDVSGRERYYVGTVALDAPAPDYLEKRLNDLKLSDVDRQSIVLCHNATVERVLSIVFSLLGVAVLALLLGFLGQWLLRRSIVNFGLGIPFEAQTSAEQIKTLSEAVVNLETRLKAKELTDSVRNSIERIKRQLEDLERGGMN